MNRSPGTGVRVSIFLLSVAGAGLLFVLGFPPAAPDRLPVLGLVLALALLGAWRPSRAILVFAFLFPCAGLLARLSGGAEPFAWPALLFGGFAAGWSFRFIYDFENEPQPSALDGPLSALLLVWVLATALAAARASTLWAVLHGLTGRAVNGDGMEDAAAIRESLLALSSLAAGAGFFLILRRSGSEIRQKTLRAAILGVAVSATAAGFERAGLLPPEANPFWRLTKRLSGGAADPNSLGLLCAIGLVVVLAGLPARRFDRRTAIESVLLSAGLLLSGSRAGLLLILLGALALAATAGLRRVGRTVVVAISGVALVALAAMLLRSSGGTLGSRIAQSFDPNLPIEYRVSARPALWRAGWRLFLQHPIEGAGMGTFAWTFPDLMRQEGRRFGMRDNPGSGYVQALAETGIAGLFLTGLFLWKLAVQAVGRARDDDALLRGAGVAALAFLGALAAGSHWLAADVSLLFFLIAASLPSPEVSPEGGARRPRNEAIVRIAAVFVFVVAAAAAIVSTARPAEAFRWSSRIGFHAEESGPGGPFRWTRRRFALWLAPRESRRLVLAHFSPIPSPVELSATLSGRPVFRRTLKTGESVSLALQGSPAHARPILFEVSRAFIPKRLGLSPDRRELGLLSLEPR